MRMAKRMARRRTAELRRPDAEPAAVEAGGGVEAAGADGAVDDRHLPTFPTLLAWLENDLPEGANGLVLGVAH